MVTGDEVIRRGFDPFRDLVLADLGAVPAAGMEFTAAWWVHRAGNVSFEDLDLLSGFHIRGRDRVHQRFGVGVERMIEDLLRIRQFNNIAEVHDADAVGDVLYNGHIMGDEQIGKVLLFLEVLQKVQDLGLDRNIQRADRFIADDEARLDCKRTGDADALTLTAGELVRVAVDEIWLKTGVVHDFQNVFLV